MFYESEEFIEGKVTISDNVEDEWYIISLLFRISENLDNVVIQVNDQDGEVLLIESADVLPKWAQDPEMVENRVFICRGAVHIIPIAKSPAELTPLPSANCPEVEDAIQTVFRFSNITKASYHVQNAIRSRMKNYPNDWSDLMHYTHLLVPKNLQYVLENAKSNNLISKAIRLFYHRDHIDLKVCRLLKQMNPKSGQLELVKVGLNLTKCLYAMLSKQKFNPDKKSGWPTSMNDQNNPDFKALNLGAKLTCGFEILANTKTHQDDLKQSYIQSLTNKGYFQSELKGSKKYNGLLAEAEKHLLQNSSDLVVKTPAMQLCELLKEHMEDPKQSGSKKDDLKPEDDDSWIELKPETFDDMLSAHFKLKDDVTSDQSANKNKSTQDIPSEVKNFLKAMSDFEGVETEQQSEEITKSKITKLPKNISKSEESKSPITKSLKKKPKSDESDKMIDFFTDQFEGVDFNAEDFESAFKKVLGITDSDAEDQDENSESDSDSDQDSVDMDEDLESEEMSQYFMQMSSELKDTKVTDPEDSEDWTKPLDIDSNVLSNLMESFRGQGGLPGPASTLLEPLGIN